MTSSPPSRPIVLRAALLTATFFIFLIMLLVFLYYPKYTTYTLMDILESSLPISLGILIGVVVIWLVFPSSYAPKYYDEFFPKISWVFLWYLFFAPLVFVTISGISPFDYHKILLSTDSPLNSVFYNTENIAFLTYLIFFLALGLGVKKHMPHGNNAPRVQ